MLVADSCALGNYWLLRLPDYCSNKHPPASGAGLVDSAGQRGGSGAVWLSCSPAKPNLPGPSPAHPRQAAEMGEQVTEKLRKQTSENKPLISESVAETRWRAGGRGLCASPLCQAGMSGCPASPSEHTGRTC